MRYPVTLEAYEHGFTVSFPDIPEALTRGDDREDAMRNAADALESALDFYFEADRTVPLPSQPDPRQETVELSQALITKVSAQSTLSLSSPPRP